MSSDSSDEDTDMPDLESVSSSEYIEDLLDFEDDMCPIPRIACYPDPPLPEWSGMTDTGSDHYRIAQQWLEQDRISIDQQLNVIAVYLFSPFLYGHAHQSDVWLRWCKEAGLLTSDSSFKTESLTEKERSAVDLLESALLYCKNTMSNRKSPDSLSLLLQLASQIQPQEKCREPPLDQAVRTAGESSWFMVMVKELQVSSSTESILSQVAIELGCLYVINQTAEHVVHHVEKEHDYYKEFQEKVQSDLEAMEDLKKIGDDLYNLEKKHKEAIETYSTAIACCPYNYKLYTNRALAYMDLKDYKSSLCDGLRAVILNPSFPKGYIRFIVALKACNETTLLLKISEDYSKRFTGCKERELLKTALEKFSASVKHMEASPQDHGSMSLIQRSCRLGSEAYLRGDTDMAIINYKEALNAINTDKTVRLVMPAFEWKTFCVILCYALGIAHLKDSRESTTDMALKGFQGIISEYRVMHFAPAHLGAAQALIKLHQHSQALVVARNGLSELPLNRVGSNVTWPGTDTPIAEASNVEAELQKICSICEPVCVPDAVCRYPTCSQHNKSANITIVSEDYKGHVLLTCSESCSIAYHPTCWRRFKNDSIINSDRDFLLTPCPTPDCSGEVSSVSVFDLKGKCKIKFEPPANKGVSVESQYTKRKLKKKEAKASKNDKHLKKKSSIESDSVKEEPVKKTSTDSGIDTLVARETPSASGDSPSTSGDSPSVSGESTVEDSRKLEDSVDVIDRQAEADQEENKENIRVKPKKRKEKKLLTELGFAFTERPLARNDSTPEEEDGKRSAKWVPDSNAPFQTPAHLKEAIEEFEKVEGLSRVSEPRPPAPPTETKKKPDDFEFIFSYFREVFKSQGGLHPTDPQLTNALELLPEDKKAIIESSGGLKNFLLMSPSFKTQGELICLFEDASVIAASIISEDTLNKQRQAVEEPVPARYAKMYELKLAISEPSGQLEIVPPATTTLMRPVLNPGPTPPEALALQKRFAEEEKEMKKEREIMRAREFNRCMDGMGRKDSIHLSDKEFKKLAMNLMRGGGAPAKMEKVLKPARDDELALTKPDSTKLVNGIDKETPDDKLLCERDKLTEKSQSELVMGREKHHSLGKSLPSLVSVGVNACPATKNKYSNTIPIPPVETFKDRYDITLKEKLEIQSKLERCEDQKYKMIRDHKRELDKVQKQAKAEAKESYQFRIEELERRVANEKEKVNSEKKEHNELTKALKTEIKSLSEKIERIKREAAKKEKQSENSLVHTRSQLEDSNLERAKLDERLSKQIILTQQSRRRSVEAEVEILNMRRDLVQRPVELRLREIDGILMNLPKDNEFYREWEIYREKLKTALDCFAGAMEDQVKQVQLNGKLLSKLEPVPGPAVPLPPQLASFRMPFPIRPPFMPRMVRPTSSGFDQAPGPRPSHDRMPHPLVGPNPPGALPGPIGPGPIKPPVSLGASVSNDHSPGASLADLEPSASGKKMSSFDRIVEKIAPTYPQFNKVDFKNVLREVRRNNGNTLSGLSLDNIATQIMAILDARTGRPTNHTAAHKPLAVGGVVSGKGKRSESHPSGLYTKPQRSGSHASGLFRLPPVATAEPPKVSDVEYDNDGWCIICYEDMCEEDSSTLNCGHRFHSECIRSWFNEQSTCPTCRNHSLLPDEYPSLK